MANVAQRGLLAAWGAVVVTAIIGAWPEMRGFLGLAWVMALVVSIVTLQQVRTESLLLAKRWYRCALVMLVLTAAAETVAAASTLVVTNEIEQPGFLFVAAAGVALVVVAWRALTRPTAKRAAWAGALALCLPCAGLVDIVAGTAGAHATDIRDGVWPTVMVGGFGALCITGVLACLAAITAFGAPSTLPEARQID